ncbi:hypothetical protein [Demequina litorisediminis]|nr:hypothetical protein [Demequina litorisediminis]
MIEILLAAVSLIAGAAAGYAVASRRSSTAVREAAHATAQAAAATESLRQQRVDCASHMLDIADLRDALARAQADVAATSARHESLREQWALDTRAASQREEQLIGAHEQRLLEVAAQHERYIAQVKADHETLRREFEALSAKALRGSQEALLQARAGAAWQGARCGRCGTGQARGGRATDGRARRKGARRGAAPDQ